MLVYPSSGAAVAARLQAEVNNQLRQAGRPVTIGRESPRLVTGYGPSAWRGNIALVQTTQGELTRAFRAQHDTDNLMDGTPVGSSRPSTSRSISTSFRR